MSNREDEVRAAYEAYIATRERIMAGELPWSALSAHFTEDAVFTRSGWIGREQRIAPLSRVQTVDSHQSVLMRPFHLSTITVTTASPMPRLVITEPRSS